MKPLINAVLACTLLLCACDREKEFDFPRTLYACEISQASDIRLFVGEREVYDVAVIGRYVEGEKHFFALPTEEDLLSSNENIFFWSKDSVQFGTLTTGFTVRKDANRFLFYSPQFLQEGEDHDFVRPLFKYVDEPQPLFFPAYLTREIRVGYGSYNNLELSVLSYKRTQTKVDEDDAFSMRSVAGRAFNEFDEAVVNTLHAGDTLAIREYRVRFVEK